MPQTLPRRLCVLPAADVTVACITWCERTVTVSFFPHVSAACCRHTCKHTSRPKFPYTRAHTYTNTHTIPCSQNSNSLASALLTVRAFARTHPPPSPLLPPQHQCFPATAAMLGARCRTLTSRLSRKKNTSFVSSLPTRPSANRGRRGAEQKRALPPPAVPTPVLWHRCLC